MVAELASELQQAQQLHCCYLKPPPVGVAVALVVIAVSF